MSLEKLVIDNEICGMALRLDRGIETSEETLAVELIRELGPGGDYLSTDHTLAGSRRSPTSLRQSSNAVTAKLGSRRSQERL